MEVAGLDDQYVYQNVPIGSTEGSQVQVVLLSNYFASTLHPQHTPLGKKTYLVLI